MRLPPLSHRAILAIIIVALAILALALFSAVRPGPTTLDRIQQVRYPLAELVQQMVAEGKLARRDGYVYAVDVGQLMTYAALSGNEPLYQALRNIVVEHLLIDDPANPYTAGFIAWRYALKPAPPDASGTTEALRVAEALWLGANVFAQEADHALAIKILHGYARHEYVDQSQWLIRNYYNLQTNAFAPHSYLVDYDPDLLSLVAQAADDKKLQAIALESIKLVDSALTSVGLLRCTILPDILTLMPDARSVQILSPNNIEQLSNSLVVAQRSVLTNRHTAQRVLNFAVAQLNDLRLYYDSATGQVVARESDNRPGIETYAPMLRLAIKLDDSYAHDRILPHLLLHARRLLKSDKNSDTLLYMTTEALLALEYSTRYQPGQPLAPFPTGD